MTETKKVNGERVVVSPAKAAAFRAGQAIRSAEELRENADEAAEKTRRENVRASALQKLKNLGMSPDEAQEIVS